MAKLHFYYSAMNAGKSTLLLQSSHNYKERGMETMIFTAALDNRYGLGKVTSRIGLEADAYRFGPEDDLLQQTKNTHTQTPISCVLVDEAQFLTVKQVWQLTDVADHLGVPVICYGLRTDFQGKLFPGSDALLALADNMREVKTICDCGSKATMVVRYDDKGNPVREGDQVEIGGNDRYVSMCRKHWKETLRT